VALIFNTFKMLNQGQHCFSPMPGMDSIDELSAALLRLSL
jgi:hypothetical protein